MNFIQYTVLPGTCICCHRLSCRDKDLCQDCELSLQRISTPCLRCGLPLPPGKYHSQVCGHCLAFPPPHIRLIAPFNYTPPVSMLISAFKYRRRLVNGRIMTELLRYHLIHHYREAQLPSLLIPMPLHKKRQRLRGFNQALAISRQLSGYFDIALDNNACHRIKPARQQKGLTARQRKSNIRNAFSVNKETDFSAYPIIAIVDDVVTTGATVSELGKILLRAGAREIHVWALARTCL